MAKARGERGVIELALDSGETVHVQRIGIWLARGIQLAVEALYPPVEVEAYKVAVEGMLVEGERVLTPEAEAAYHAAVAERNLLVRNATVQRQCAAAVSLPRGQAQALEDYADALAQMRAVADLPDDPWVALVNFVLIVSPRDLNDVTDAARGTLPLDEGEVVDGMRIFRPSLRRDALRAGTDAAAGDDHAAGAPGDAGSGALDDGYAAGRISDSGGMPDVADALQATAEG